MKNVKKLLFFLLLLNFKSFGQFTLQITAAGAGSGQISVNGVTQNSTYSAQFTSNETVNLSAIANTGSHFFDWSGDLVSTNSNESILMDSDKSITITFELNQYQINLSQEPPVGGTVTGGGNYLYGDEAVVSATSNSSYDFVNWTENGTQVSTSATFNFTVNSSKNLVANFALKNYNISGNTGIGSATLTWLDGTTKTATSAVNGSYTITVPFGWSGTITPSKTGYTFNPSQKSYVTVISNQSNQNYSAELNTFTISGNTGIGSTTLTWIDGTTKTSTSGSDGSYTISVPYDWSGTVTPSKPGYTFTPIQKSYSNIVSNQSNQNYSAELNTISISGSTGIGSATLTWVDGTTKTSTSGSDGSYSISVPYGWSGAVTPTKTGYTFTPTQKSYSNIIASQVNQNYTAAINNFTISGNAGTASVTLTWVDGTTKTTTSNSDGSYSLSVPYSWSGTITPTKIGFTFSPTQKNYSNVISIQSNQDYIASINTFTISGNVGTASATLTWVDGTTKSATSGSDGSYSISVPYGWSGTVAPSKTGYSFTPAQKIYSNVIANQTNQNYTGSINTYSISGNTGIGTVLLTWIDDTEQTTTSAANGTYTITVPYDWSGTVTPTKTGYTFVPPQKTYSNVIINQTNQNYSGTINTFTISGNTGTGSATLTWFDETEKTINSATNGNYTITVPYGWSGTVTPSKIGYSFSPAQKTYSNVVSYQVNQNYSAALNAYTISGNTGVGFVTLTWVDQIELTTTSDQNGNYSISVPFGWSGTITPSKLGYTFTPQLKNYSDVEANLSNQNYTAALNKFGINFTLLGTGSGKIKVNGTVHNLPYSEEFNYNSIVAIEGIPSVGSNFTNWSGDISGTTNPTSVNVISNKNIGVNFSIKKYSIYLSKAPVQGGTVTGAGDYDYGKEATVIATPSKGYSFTNWTENNITVSLDSLYKFTVDTSRTLTANFSRRVRTVTAFVNPELSGVVTGAGNYNEGDLVKMIAFPSNGWRFVNWTENNNVLSADSIYSFNILFNRAITGNFTKKKYAIVLSINPEGSGNLNGAGEYHHGDIVTVSTSANEGWVFKNWTENEQNISSNSTYSFTISSPRNFTANYEKKKYTITTSAFPIAGGTTAGGATYSHGDTVTIVATPKSSDGYDFINWTENGSEVSTNNTFTFLADNNRTLVANFRLRTYSILLSAYPANSGSVTGGNTYTHGQNVVAQASPSSGWLFVNWTEDNVNVSNNSTYGFIANKNRTLTANFSKDIYSISSVSSPLEAGSISGTGSFYYGQTATLIAEANPGWKFVNWTKNGTIVSSDTAYIFNVTGSESFVANFKLADYLINCSSLPIEGGFTSGCGIARYNQIMTLQAEANDGYRFINWTENGVIVSSDAQYEFTVKKSINVIANFDFISSIEREDFESIPDHYFMSNAYPNPFNPETKIKFGLPEQSIVNLIIVDITGRIVDNAIDGVILPAGNFTNNFSGKNLASGIYFFILNSKSTISEKHFRKTGKLILLK